MIFVYACMKVENRPPQYGSEYHGICSREKTSELLGSEDGMYLVRTTGKEQQYILSFM